VTESHGWKDNGLASLRSWKRCLVAETVQENMTRRLIKMKTRVWLVPELTTLEEEIVLGVGICIPHHYYVQDVCQVTAFMECNCSHFTVVDE